MHYYSHHIGDFKSATGNLDDHQLATYLRMIWSYYDKEKPIQGEIEDIAFAMRSDEKTVRLLLRHFFTETPDGWINERCQREIDAYHDKSDKARNSAKARWSNANAMRTHTERNATEPVLDANQEPITININTSSSDDLFNSVVDLYHEILPDLPSVKIVSPKRKAQFKARVKSYSKANDIEWWRVFFTKASESNFMMGRTGNWQASLDYFLQPNGFAAVIEGKHK